MLPQVPIKEIRSGMIGSQPALVAQEIMDFIRKYQLLKLDVMFAQLANQIDRLTECDITVIVSVDQKHR